MSRLTQRISSAFNEKSPKPLAVLFSELDIDVNHEKLSHATRDDYLEQLKMYTRTPEEAAPLCTKQGVLLLCRHGFDHGTAKTSRTALKCLANIMLLVPRTRQMFVDLNYPSRAAELYKHDYREDEFLSARILFLVTYETDFDFNTMFEETQLLETINRNLMRHATHFQSTALKRGRQASVGDAAAPVARNIDRKALEAANQIANMALSESLKFLFNLSNFYPSIKPALAPSLAPCLRMLQKIKITEHPLEAPITYIINGILALELEGRRSDLFPSMGTRINVDRLILILDLALRRENDSDLDRTANPLLALLRNLYEKAPKSVKVHMRTLILPSEKDREKPLGQSDSMSSRLLKLSNSASAPTIAKSIQEFLFEMSGKDATRFVRNIGYGFAAGFLMSHNINVPDNAFDAFSIDNASSLRVEEIDDEDDEVTDVDETLTVPAIEESSYGSTSTYNFATNPITGQRTDMEETDDEDNRSEDEKLREAERLFTLFERLRATGVVNVENPVERAAREGKLD